MAEIKVTDVRCQKGDSSFLIDDGKTSILYDTGFGFTGFEVAKNIQKALGDRQLDYIFLTHSHYDHALGSAYILRYYPNAKVVAGRYASEIFKRDGAKRTMRELDRKFADTCGVGEYEFLGDELRVDIPCDDGDIIKAGDMSFEVISLPGHTKCSVGYYCKELEFFLSTETLGVYDENGNILPSCLVGYKLTMDSIARAEKLKIKTMISPHYGLLSEERTKFFLENMKSKNEGIILGILEDLKQGKSEDEILKDFMEKYWYGYVQEIYPYDAMKLNMSIMFNLIRKELM